MLFNTVYLINFLGNVALIFAKKKSYFENDVLDKTEVVMRFPMYAMHLPPIFATRMQKNVKVNPIPVSCKSSNITKSLSELRNKIVCEPRDTVVAVEAPDGLMVTPNTVVVKRCGGMCNGAKKCRSSKRRMVQFYVRTTSFKSTSLMFCNTVQVPEDTACKCACPANRNKSTCGPGQRFDKFQCRCICDNILAYDKCVLMSNEIYRWDPKTCSCKCKQDKVCTTGTVWVPSSCRCMKV